MYMQSSPLFYELSFVVAGETLERDTFKSAAEARDFGLIDEVIEKRPVEAPVGT